MYSKFYGEFLGSQAYYKKKIAKDDGKTQYIVGKYGIETLKWKSTVIQDVSCGDKFTCSCAKFEMEGMFCRHVMAIIRPLIPNQITMY